MKRKTAEQRRQEDLLRMQEFCLMDDVFMTKCFEGDTACVELVLRIVMEMPGLKVLDVQTQVFVENLAHRSVRLDILATDSDGRKINVEIQRSDRGAGQKRARYNSSMMDASLLEKGEDFSALPETWVIFITENDVLGMGRPLYHYMRCLVDTGEPFNDGSHILYVNGAYRGDTPVGKLMHDFSCPDPAEMNYRVLADRVRLFKEQKKGAVKMSRVMDEFKLAWHEEFMEDVALRMLEKKKYGMEEIAELTGLSLEELKELSEEEDG